MWNIVLISTFLVTLQLSVNGDVSHLVGQQGHNHHHHHHHDNHPGYPSHKPSNPLDITSSSTHGHETSHPGYPKEKPQKPFNIDGSGTAQVGQQYIPPITDSSGSPSGGVPVQTTHEHHQHHEHHYHGEDGKYNPHDDGRGWDIRKSVPGEPEVDYPTLASVPRTSFTCSEKNAGYYADVETRCQAFRICTTRSSNSFTSFLCPNGTLFNQNQLTCDWWNNVDCEHSDQYYYKNDQIGKMPEGPQLMYEINKMLQAPFMTSHQHKYELDNQIQGTAENQQGIYLPPKVHQETTTSGYKYPKVTTQKHTYQETTTAGYKYPKPKPTPNQLHLQKEYHQQQQHHQEQHHYGIQTQPQYHQQTVQTSGGHQHQQHQYQQQHQHQQHQQHQYQQQHQQHSQSSDSSSSSSINQPSPVYGVSNQVGSNKQGKKTISVLPFEPPKLPDKHETYTTTTSKPYTYASTTIPSTTVTYPTTTYTTTTTTTTTPRPTTTTTTTTPRPTTTTPRPTTSTTTPAPSTTTPKLHLSQISKPNPQPLFVSEEKTKASSQSSQENQLFTSPMITKDKSSEDGMLFTSPFISQKTQTKDAQPLFVSPEKQGMLFTSPFISKNNTLFTSQIKKTPQAPEAPKVQFLSSQITNNKPTIATTTTSQETGTGPHKVTIGLNLPVTTSTQNIAQHQQQQQVVNIQEQFNKNNPFNAANIGAINGLFSSVQQQSGVQQQHSGVVQQNSGVQYQYGVPNSPIQTSTQVQQPAVPELTKEQAFEQINKLQSDLTAFYNQLNQQHQQNQQTLQTQNTQTLQTQNQQTLQTQNQQTLQTQNQQTPQTQHQQTIQTQQNNQNQQTLSQDQKNKFGHGEIDIREQNKNPLTIPINSFGVPVTTFASGKSIQFGAIPTNFQDRSDFAFPQSQEQFQNDGFAGYQNIPNGNGNGNVKYEFSKDGYLNQYNGDGLTFHGNGAQTYSKINGHNTGFKETTKVEIIPAISFEIKDDSGPNFHAFLGGYNGQQHQHQQQQQQNSYPVGQQFNTNQGHYNGQHTSNFGQTFNQGHGHNHHNHNGGQQHASSNTQQGIYQGPSSYLVPQKSVLQLPSDSGYRYR